MNGPLIPQEDYLRTVLDAIPAMVVVMDRKLRILDANRAAIEQLGRGEPVFLREMCGEILGCANLVTADDECGETPSCRDCRIKEATELTSTGVPVLRKHHRMELRSGEGITEVHFLVTSSEFVYYGKTFAMIVLEDVTELMQLRTVVPVCRHCSRVRIEDNLWEPLDRYLLKGAAETLPLVCPDCRARSGS